MYVIYLDVLYLINWVMDLMIFYCVSLILNRHVRCGTLVLASAIAALVYCMLVVIPILQKIPYGIYALVVPIPSLLILFKPKTYRTFIRQYIVSLLVGALFGGGVFSIWSYWYGGGGNVSNISILMLIAIGLGISTIFYLGFRWLRRQFIFPAFSYQLVLKDHGESVQIQALLDTGNTLYTYRSHQPVLVVEYGGMKKLLSKQQRQAYEQFSKCKLEEVEAKIMDGSYSLDELIPFNSVGCPNGFLWALEIERIEMKNGTKKIEIAPCMVGISSERLFEDHQFHALLHPEFILKEEKIS